jgi:hypothetical protein
LGLAVLEVLAQHHQLQEHPLLTQAVEVVQVILQEGQAVRAEAVRVILQPVQVYRER